jgi:mono/diheme cytochrome c family protein
MSDTTKRAGQMTRRILFFLVGAAALLFIVAVVLLDSRQVLTVKLPDARPADVAQMIRLPQDGWQPNDPGFHWDDPGRKWFHHVSQGTTIMPYDWLLALEQPDIGVLHSPKLFLDRDYMSRFGFLPGELDAQLNPDRKLPLGWAITNGFVDPTAPIDKPDAYNAKPYNAVGLTCAACHTGRLTYTPPGGNKVDILIEGGSAVVNLRALQKALGQALLYTLYVPGRFERFAALVLKDKNTREARNQLRAQVDGWFQEAVASNRNDAKRHVNELDSGAARTDALSLIGNRVFGPIKPGNVVAAVSPVNFPHIWGTAWFDWVQYNAAIRMVMVRNIGEALGVGARTNVTPGDSRLLQSTVNVANLHRIEDQLGGPEPYRGLLAPKWSDAVKLAGFPPLKPALVQRGEELYKRFCLACHGPSVDELKKDLVANEPKYWEKSSDPAPFNRRLLRTPLLDLPKIGTDPSQAADFASRFALVPDPFPLETKQALEELDPQQVGRGGPTQPGGDPGAGGPATLTVTAVKGLRVITEEIRERAYKEAGLSNAERVEWDRWRQHKRDTPDKDVIIARLKYKARPLDGVWATPPYLHNASVPNLDALLSPVAARPGSFTIGSTEYDTTLVGFRTDGGPYDFTIDTSLSGNYNTGHEFRNLTLLELELYTNKTSDLASVEPPIDRWAKLLGMTPEEYKALAEEERRKRRQDLSEKAIADKTATFFGVIGRGLDKSEREAIIEYVKSL